MFNSKRSQDGESYARSLRRISALGATIAALVAAAGGCLSQFTHAQESESAAAVSAASYDRAALAPGSLATVFGANLAPGTASAGDVDPLTPGVQLPTTLGGTTVRVKGVAAPLLFVSPNQVNFVIPESVAPSANETDFIPFEISSGTAAVSSGKMILNTVAPAIFCMNGDGQGNPAAYLVRVKNDQNQIERLIDQDATGRPVFKPVNFGDVSQTNPEKLFLILFLSGIRKAADANQDGNLNESLVVSLNGFEFKPLFAGPQPDFPGLDQINVELPRKFLGSSQVEIEIRGGVKSNRVIVPFVVPRRPTAESQTVALNEDESASIMLAGSDPDGDPLAYELLSLPTHGRLEGIAPNLTYVPFPNYAGQDSFSYIARDGLGASAPAVVTLNVAPVNDLMELSASGTEISIVGGFVRIEIRGVDPDGELVTVAAGGLPAGATFDQGANQSTAIVKWNPTSAGVFTFSFIATQSGSESVTKDFKVTVTPSRPSDTWAEVPLFTEKSIKGVLAAGEKIYAALASVSADRAAALLRSIDNGRTWERIGAGLPVNVATYDLVKSGEALYLSCSEGLYRSNDDGASWKDISQGKGLPLDGGHVSLAAQGNKLVAWNLSRIFISLDKGESWTEATNRLPIIPTGFSVNPGGVILSAAVTSGAVLVSLNPGIIPVGPIIFRSIDDGVRWEPAKQGMTGPYSVSSFLVEGNRIYGNHGFYLFSSDDDGATWNALEPPVRRPSIFNGLIADETTGFLLIAYSSGEIQGSSDNGVSWSRFSSIPGEIGQSFALGESSLFAVTQSGKLFIHPR